MDNSLFVSISSTIVRLYQIILFYIFFYSGLSQELKPVLESEPDAEPKSEPKPVVPYEKKYLDAFRALDYNLIFTSNPENQEVCKEECQTMLEKIKNKMYIIKNFNQWRADSNCALNDETKDYIRENFHESKYIIQPKKLWDDSDSDSESDFNDKDENKNHLVLENICYNISEILQILDKTLKNVEYEIEHYPSQELLTIARETVCKNILDYRLFNNFVMDATPIGNVIMRYSAKSQLFEYFSDRDIPQRFLEVLARKYVCTFYCPHLYIDTDAEIKQLEQINEKNEREKEKREMKNVDTNVLNKSKQIFAKFKPYNMKPSSRSAKMSMPMKNRSMESTSPFRFKLKNDENQSTVMLNRANVYLKIGRISDFPVLQTQQYKPVSKASKMTFAEYKASMAT
jgi:hypothetical protein